LGAAYCGAGHADKVLEALAEAGKLSNGDEAIGCFLALAYHRCGDVIRARIRFEKGCTWTAGHNALEAES
jgi:hypothetical protein